jgi:hypothetical protein
MTSATPGWTPSTIPRSARWSTRSRARIPGGLINSSSSPTLPGRANIRSTVREWAAANGLRVEHNDHLEIQVRVTLQQLARFLDETFGAERNSAAAPLQRHVRERLRDDCTYLLAADEF